MGAIQKIQNKMLRLLNGCRLLDKINTQTLLKKVKMLSVNQTSWLKTATKNIPGETDSEVLPYFKAIVKKRLVSGSGCLGPE